MSIDSSSVEEPVKYLAVVERAKNIAKQQNILLLTGWVCVYAIEQCEGGLLIFYFKDKLDKHSSIMVGEDDIICRAWDEELDGPSLKPLLNGYFCQVPLQPSALHGSALHGKDYV